ncbi:hypothetical protein UA08_02258 [Talaromyces atroroseus]|uniref:Uncharacterized protein n=1 Tax=Talaromyces atroroseus TaxID=1441469 RepID=A0A225AXM9_TALAT|nr:hypothetical protein UA08_02258 [Talaromyces atroroseus]OKL62088.1 hypothetical protein UA08_02258 [Talaromyces atroroseus]
MSYRFMMEGLAVFDSLGSRPLARTTGRRRAVERKRESDLSLQQLGLYYYVSFYTNLFPRVAATPHQTEQLSSSLLQSSSDSPDSQLPSATRLQALEASTVPFHRVRWIAFGTSSTRSILAELAVMGPVSVICSGISGALPETHTAITATRLSVVTETSYPASATASVSSTVVSILPSSNTIGASPISSATLTTSTDGTILSSTATTTIPAITSIPATITTSAASTATTSAASSSHTSASLSSSDVIGVSVASGVSAIFLVGVSIFFCTRRLRRRRQNKESKEIFEIGGQMSEPPDFTAAALRGSLAGGPNVPGIGSTFNQFPSQPMPRQGSTAILTQPGKIAKTQEIGPSPKTEYGGSPQSQVSQHTVSHLLPAGTASGIVPEPLRLNRQPLIRPQSEATVFDEEEQRPGSIFGPPLVKAQSLDARSTPDSKQDQGGPVRGMGLPPDPRPRRQDQMSFGPSGYPYKWEKSAASIPTASQNDNSNNGHPALSKRLSPQGASRTSPVQPGNGNTTLQRNFSRLGRQTNTPRSAEASTDTSHKTIEAEDEWTEKNKLSIPPQLTTVQDRTPANEVSVASQSSPVRYPAMPRSAAIVPASKVTRRSQKAELYTENTQIDTSMDGQAGVLNRTAAAADESRVAETHGRNTTFFIDSSSRSRSSSPSSLLAKRRGETVADEMENQFRSGVHPKYPAVSGADKGRERRKPVRGAESSEALGKTPRSGIPSSPHAHSITPTRRGEDLYLRVD